MDIDIIIEKLNQDYNWLEAHEMEQMKHDILDAINTIIYLNKELESTKIFANNYKKALEALK